ncbi:MAG: hypothetical protein JJT89_17180 [Nitriliruptoraceae bacterium]|nr:hypothetical protein [Nitriliruptoraceae bacterium]
MIIINGDNYGQVVNVEAPRRRPGLDRLLALLRHALYALTFLSGLVAWLQRLAASQGPGSLGTPSHRRHVVSAVQYGYQSTKLLQSRGLRAGSPRRAGKQVGEGNVHVVGTAPAASCGVELVLINDRPPGSFVRRCPNCTGWPQA